LARVANIGSTNCGACALRADFTAASSPAAIADGCAPTLPSRLVALTAGFACLGGSPPASAIVRPVATDSGRSSSTSGPPFGAAHWSSPLISSQLSRLSPRR